MSPALQITLALGSIAVLLGLMWVVRQLAARWNLPAEMQRKLVHVGTGLYALCLPWLFPERWPVYVLVAVTLAVMLVLRLPGSKLGATLHGVERQSYGDLCLALSVGFCLFFAGDRLFLYVLPIAVLTLADAAAALAGSAYGTRFFKIEEGKKSIEGSAVFFLLTLLISVICLMLMTTIPPLNIVLLSVMVACFGTLIEATSWRGFDNLFLPMGLLIYLATHANSSVLELVMLAGLFALSIVAFKTVSPRIGLSNHAARVYVTTVFLILAVTEFQNALIPILVLAAHAWSRTAAPCRGAYPDLDIVAGLAIVSFGWLVIGEASGWNAVSFYGITAIGMLMALCAIAVSTRALAQRALVFVALIIAVGVIRAETLLLNADATNWNGPMWGVLAASGGLAFAVPSLWPQMFLHARVARVTLVSAALPLIAFAVSIGLTWGST